MSGNWRYLVPQLISLLPGPLKVVQGCLRNSDKLLVCRSTENENVTVLGNQLCNGMLLEGMI